MQPGHQGDWDYVVLAHQFLPQYCRDLRLGVLAFFPLSSHHCRDTPVCPQVDSTLAHHAEAVCSADAVTNQLTLHGLWPNYNEGFPACCNTTKTANSPLDPMALSKNNPALMARMRAAWPDPVESSMREGLCYLHNHEFQKHGYCYGAGFVEGNVQQSAVNYFTAALDLHDKLPKAPQARYTPSTRPYGRYR